MLALDQVSSIEKLIQNRGDTPTDEEITQGKAAILRTLKGLPSAILLDPHYGLKEEVKKELDETPLLLRLEASGYEQVEGGRVSRIEENWSVDKAKEAGASAVKLLVYFNSGNAVAGQQMELVTQVSHRAKEVDIPFLLEVLTYPIPTPKLIIEAAKLLSPFCDIYKAEFPGEEHLKELTQASTKPWVLLSAGVDFEEFEKQTELAMKGGASGILAGRAIWKEYFLKKSPEEKEKFLEVARERFVKLRELVDI